MAGGKAEIELESGAVSQRLVLTAERTTLGKGGVDFVVSEGTVSRVHAAIDRVTGGWVIQDLGSRNGTHVNGVRVAGLHALRNGDEIRLGAARIRFTDRVSDEEHSLTAPIESAPRLTSRERDALVALCRPVLLGSMLDEPASVRTIAGELVVSESAVKKLLSRCYDKFGLGGPERRRGRLALEALRRGCISLSDVSSSP